MQNTIKDISIQNTAQKHIFKSKIGIDGQTTTQIVQIKNVFLNLVADEQYHMIMIVQMETFQN
jgi:hypothetical protein